MLLPYSIAVGTDSKYQALSVRHWYSSKSNLESSKVVGNFSLRGRTDSVWDFPIAEISLRSDLCFLTRPAGQRLLLESTTWTWTPTPDPDPRPPKHGVSVVSGSWPHKKKTAKKPEHWRQVIRNVLLMLFFLKFCMSNHSEGKRKEKSYFTCYVLLRRSERWIVVTVSCRRGQKGGSS